jgi:PhnB protein
MAPAPKPIPDAHRRVTPLPVVQGGVKALAFYAAVFGPTERMCFPGPGRPRRDPDRGSGGHHRGCVPGAGTKAPPPGGVAGSPSFLFCYVEDVDAVVTRAVELGATLQRPPQDQFYGDRDG